MLEDMFAQALSVYWETDMTWTNVLNWYGDEDADTVAEIFQKLVTAGNIQNAGNGTVYDFIIEQKGYVPKATFTCNGQTQTNVALAQFVITNPGTYTIEATTEEKTGSLVFTTTKCKVEEFSEICTEKTYLKAGANGIVTPVTSPSDTVVAVVPAGFAYGIDTNVGKVSTGLVITDSVNENNYSTGNEFVWIPVDYTPATNETAETIAVAGKTMAKLQSGSSENYEGVLYDFSGTGANTISTVNSNYTANGSSYGEPRILTSQSHISAGSIDGNIEQTLNLQGKYNTMIEKIIGTGGFYVGRYELGEGSNEISQLGVIGASVGGYCADDRERLLNQIPFSYYKWYDLYDKAGSYIHPNLDYTGTVTTEMIWGAQYDAVLNFALSGNDKAKVTSEEVTGSWTVTRRTGARIPNNLMDDGTYDKIMNIFDLGGNYTEFTAEAVSSTSRAYRGGDCYAIRNKTPAMRDCYYAYPNVISGNYIQSTRAVLYIN